MANFKVEFLKSFTNQAGVTSWYIQPSKTLKDAGWMPYALGKIDRGAAIKEAEAFKARVELWRAGGQAPNQIREKKQSGTLGALIERYRREIIKGTKPDGKPNIAASTAKTYTTALKRLEIWAGKQPLAFVTPSRVKALRDQMLKTIGHDPAHKTLKMGRTLFAFAISCDMVERNPFAAFGLAPPAPRDIIWSEPAREAMVAAARATGQHSIALAILLGFAIGQREGDLLAMIQSQYVAIPAHKMQPEDYATLSALAPDGVPRGIRIRQNKTKAWIEVPVTGDVRAAVETAIARAQQAGVATILIDDTRSTVRQASTWSGEAAQTRFQRDFADIRSHAITRAEQAGDQALAEELATLQFRDLRRTCVVYLGELGMDAHLIAGVTGHDIDETQAILKTYMPRTTGRAARAIALSVAREASDQKRKERG